MDVSTFRKGADCDRFDLSYFRHTARWFTVYRDVCLAEALSRLESESIFHAMA